MVYHYKEPMVIINHVMHFLTFQMILEIIEEEDLLENSKYSEVNLNLTEITKKNPIDSYNLLSKD